jgi:hypothetical protein
MQVKATSGTSDETALPSKEPKTAPEPEPAAAQPEPSAASSPAKAKPATLEDTPDKAAGDDQHRRAKLKLQATSQAVRDACKLM